MKIFKTASLLAVFLLAKTGSIYYNDLHKECRGKEMRYIGLSLKFIGKNILHLTVFTLLPAVALAFYYRNSSFFVFLKGIFSMEGTKNSYFYYSLISGERWYLGLIAVFAVFLLVCLVIAYVQRTMKVGGKSLKMPFIKMNETIIPVFLILIIFLLLFQLFALFASLLVDLLLRANPATYRILIPIILILLYTILFVVIILLFMAIPIMVVTGYRFREAISYSIKLSNKRVFKFTLAILLPIIFVVTLSVVLNFVTKIDALRIVLSGAIIWFILMYYPVLMMTTYYDITGMSRMDIKRKPIYFD